MNRNEWRFDFSAGELHKAAERRHAHHESRRAWWVTEQDVAEGEVHTTMLRIQRRDVSGGQRVEVTIDPTLTARLNECEQKIASHLAAEEDFARWERSFGAMPADAKYALDPEDVAYFDLPNPGQ